MAASSFPLPERSFDTSAAGEEPAIVAYRSARESSTTPGRRLTENDDDGDELQAVVLRLPNLCAATAPTAAERHGVPAWVGYAMWWATGLLAFVAIALLLTAPRGTNSKAPPLWSSPTAKPDPSKPKQQSPLGASVENQPAPAWQQPFNAPTTPAAPGEARFEGTIHHLGASPHYEHTRSSLH